MVTEVAHGGPAFMAGVQPGDVALLKSPIIRWTYGNQLPRKNFSQFSQFFFWGE